MRELLRCESGYHGTPCDVDTSIVCDVCHRRACWLHRVNANGETLCLQCAELRQRPEPPKPESRKPSRKEAETFRIARAYQLWDFRYRAGHYANDAQRREIDEHTREFVEWFHSRKE